MKHTTILLLAAMGCADGNGTVPGTTTPTTGTTTVVLDGVTAALEQNAANPMSALVTLTAQSDATVRITVDDGTWARTTPDVALQAGVATEVVVLGLAPSTPHSLGLEGDLTGDLGSFVTKAAGPLPTLQIDDRTDGTVFDPAEVICTQGANEEAERFVNYCIDASGTPRWVLETQTPILALNPMPGGGWVGSNDHEAEIVLFDAASRKLRSWFPEDFEGLTRYEHVGFDMHDAIPITQGPWAGHVAALTLVWDETPAGEHIGQGILVFHPDTGAVAWDWSPVGTSGDGVSIDESKMPLGRFGVVEHGDDWMHANALVHAPDGKFWMSVRHQDWVIVIDPDTDAIDHRIGWGGDFELVADLDAGGAGDPMDWFYHQHAPEIVDVSGDRISFLLYDNGNGRRVSAGAVVHPDYNRAARFTIDTSTMQAVNDWAYGGPSGDEHQFFSAGVGDTDLVHTGDRVALVNGWDGPFVAQVAYPSGELLWKARDVGGGGELYRVSVRPTVYDTEWGH